MDNLKHKTYKAFAWDFLGKFTNQGIGFVISVFLARLLDPADFGMLAMVNVVIVMAGVLIDMGLGSALIQRKTLENEHYGSVFYFNIFVGFILTISLFFSAELIAAFYNEPKLINITKTISFLFLINSFANVQRVWLKRNLKFKTITNSNIAALILGGSAGITLAILNYGVWALVVQQIISGIVRNLYIYLFTKWKPVLKFKFQALRELWNFGINIFFSGILETIFSQLDSLLIGKIMSPTILGFYYRAKSFDQFVIRFTSGSLMAVLFPTLSRIQDQNERYKSIIYRSFHVLNFVTFLVLGLLFLCAKDIIVILFSSKWLPSVEYFKILILSGFAYPISSLLVNIISSKGNSKAFLNLEIIKKVIAVLTFPVLYFFGIKVFLYSIVIKSIIGTNFNIYFAAKEMKVSIKWFYSIIWKYLVIGLLITILTYFFNHFYLNINSYLVHLFLMSTIFSAAYFLISYIFNLEGLKLIKFELEQIRNSRLKK